MSEAGDVGSNAGDAAELLSEAAAVGLTGLGEAIKKVCTSSVPSG